MSNHPWRNERVVIDCCKDCKPPKRYPGCGGKCPEYIAQKAKRMEEIRQERAYRENNPVLSNYDFDKLS